MLRKLFCFVLALCGKASAQVPEDLDAVLEPISSQHGLPALTAAAVRDGKVIAIGAVGVRKTGVGERVTRDDLWHIGSCTKSMTATLAAMLVDQHKLKWETTVGEIFSEWRDAMPEQWRGVRLEQLLTHRAGAPRDAPRDLWVQAFQRAGTPTEQRLAFVHGLVTRPPEATPGTKYLYSNQNYSIAGAMIERVTGKPWEGLMRTMLFEPLGMKSAGFGAPGSAEKIDAPWGHRRVAGGDITPVPPGPKADNPPAIGPAGIVHCSIGDFARYAQWHARWNSERQFLSDVTFTKLHTPPPGQDYAMGWIVQQRPSSGGMTFAHSGSNTMWFATVWVSPTKNTAFVAATNAPGQPAQKACDEAIAAMIQSTLKTR